MANIGVDIDNTVVNSNYAWWQWLELQTKAGIPWSVARKWQHMTIPYQNFIRTQEALDFWRSTYLYDDLEPIEDSVRVLEKLKNEGHRIIFISALKGNHHKSKVAWVKKYFPFYDAFLGTKEKEFVDVTHMIDDSNVILNRFDKATVGLIKYDNNDIQAVELQKNCFIVENWKQIEKIFECT